VKNESNRDLLVLLKSQLNEKAFEQELDCLNSILMDAEHPDVFCKAHELVYRNRITQKPSRILKASNHYYLPGFHFLINKN
jgi:hypothetical protein